MKAIGDPRIISAGEVARYEQALAEQAKRAGRGKRRLEKALRRYETQPFRMLVADMRAARRQKSIRAR